MELSHRAAQISASLTLAIDAKAKKMKANGMNVVGFGAGEPDFPTPDFIIEAAKEALDKGITRYTPASGTIELKQAICQKFLRDNDLEYNVDQIIVSNGAKHSLYNIFQAILNPGDEVIIPTPYWVSYPEFVKMADGIPVYVNTGEENSFKMRPGDIEKAVSPNTKALVLNSPSNPSGCVYTKKELEAIADIIVDKQFLVVSDEIYEELVYDGANHISIASLGREIKDLTLVVNGVSKAYAMTGWRIGYTAGKEEIIRVMSNIQSHATSNPNSIAQYASVRAISGSESKNVIREMVYEFDKRRKYMVKRINCIPGLSCKFPDGAFYIMMNISKLFGKNYQGKPIYDSMSFAEVLLDAQMVAVVPGFAFGADEFVRLSYATSMDNIREGLERIERFTKELQ